MNKLRKESIDRFSDGLLDGSIEKFIDGLTNKSIDKEQVMPKHGNVIEPASRATLYLPAWIARGLEAGKFFPETHNGLTDPFAEEDVINGYPPEDGRIASAGHSLALMLDDAGINRWDKHTVRPGSDITFQWGYSIKRRTRRWNYFITRMNWNPGQPLARAQFDETPFHTVDLRCRPYWFCSNELLPPEPTEHTCKLPFRIGYHVVLAVWETADTGNAFYQVIDFDFRI